MLLTAIKNHKGKNWIKICEELKHFSQEEIIFNFLKLPFINISHMKFMQNQNDLTSTMGERSSTETGLLNLIEDDGKITNPLKPHVKKLTILYFNFISVRSFQRVS